MNFKQLVPNIFYKDIRSRLKTFVECLEFKIVHNELTGTRPFCVIERDGLRINLFQDSNCAEEHNPEFRLVTDDIEEVYQRVKTMYPELLHPNLKEVTLHPWGANEFALRDDSWALLFRNGEFLC
jgi:hypothetical protein